MRSKNFLKTIIKISGFSTSILLLFLTNSCFRPPTIKKITKSPVYSYLPQSIAKEIEPGFKIEITKCNPEDLDKETYLAARRVSGDNELETQVSIESYDLKSNKNPKFQYNQAFRDIDYLVEKNIIDNRLARELKWSYSPDYPKFNDIGTINAPKTASEIHYPNFDNPYKADRYSMFRLLISSVRLLIF